LPWNGAILYLLDPVLALIDLNFSSDAATFSLFLLAIKALLSLKQDQLRLPTVVFSGWELSCTTATQRGFVALLSLLPQRWLGSYFYHWHC